MTIFRVIAAAFIIFGLMGTSLSHAAPEWEGKREGFIRKMFEKRMENRKKAGGSEKGFYTKGKGESESETVQGREIIVYIPPKLPTRGKIPLLIALHGGFGNAGHLQNYMGMDTLADKHGFIVAYLNGTAVAPGLPAKMRGWNAGGCCGQPEKKKVNDLGFIADVIDHISGNYGADKNQVYGTGHSNGAMMSMRIMCETDLYRSAAVYSGTLQMDTKKCPAAEDKRIANIHGSEDANLPIEGGHTTEGFNKKTDYKSQDYAKALFEKSGGTYDLILLKGADHSPETLNAKLWQTEGMSLPQKIVEELGLSN